MGGLLQSTHGEFEPWTGGRPLYDWSGLDSTWVTKSKSPNQLRPTSSSGAQKSYNYRQKGLNTSFDRGSDLSVFQTALLKKLQDTGLDTITYMPHPKDPKDMVSVLQYYASFTLDTVREHAKRLVPLYDQYDDANNRTATMCLLDSLAPGLANTIEKKRLESDSFAVMWMILLQTIQSTSVEVYELLKKSIKDRKPKQYAGQNLSKLAEDFRDDAKKLTIARFYDHGLTLTMMKIFLEAGGDGCCAENFRYKIYPWIEQMEEAMLTIWFMEKDDQDAHMLKKELTYRQITDQVESSYINLLNKEEWMPAKNAAPSKFGANKATTKMMTKAEIMALVQQSGYPKQQDKSCFNCGEMGHWKRVCPKLKGYKSKSDGNRQHQQDAGKGPIQKSWKLIAPKSGEQETKQNVSGRTFHWCSKCKRSSATHGTSRHTGGNGGGDNAQTQVNMGVPLLQDPSVWHIPLPLHSGDKTFPNVSLNVPFVLLTSVLLIVLYALRMLLTVIGTKNQIWSDSAAVWQAVVTLFIRNGPIMMETIESLWYYLSQSLAPLLWINLLALSLSYWRDKDKDMDTHSRHEKRAESQHRRRYDAKRG
jgi:hypothetical protein